MDSDPKDDDAATKHVLDYYKKYSQNKELPKYFSGTSVSYLPEFQEAAAPSPETETKTVVHTDINIIVTSEDVPEETSRASSALSNRKLEWDSGADIGYNNQAQEKLLRRSLSLPVLTEVERKVGAITSNHSSSSSDGNAKVILLSCSSSSSEELKQVVTPFSSSSSNLKEFASTLTYLKEKIGLPGAHSTPKEPSGSVKTSVLDVGKKENGTSLGEGSSGTKSVKYQSPKVVNLSLTKPVTVECVCSGDNLVHQSLQAVTTKASVAVQTDELTEKELVEVIKSSEANFGNQSLMYFEYSETDDKTNACSTQTNSDVLLESHCNSFEYLKKDSPGPQTQNQVPEMSNLKRARNMDDLRGETSSKDSVFDTGEDISKCVYALQRLLKSKKYDAVAKKRYIKKIIKRITESKYFEESSGSSDLFVPKKVQRTDSSGDKNEQGLLHSNVPWYPAPAQSSPRRKKLVQNTFTQNFLPGNRSSKEEVSSNPPEIVPRDTRKNRFTLTSTLPKPLQVNNSSASLEKQYESTSDSYQNWKEDKTLSEQILEKQSHSSGNGDCLVQFADKERQFQLNWIDNEITHLGKLRGLLEKSKTIHPKRKHLHLKKSTNVYTVSNGDSDSKLKRNYVIETLLGTRSAASQMNFKLDGQVYTVQEHLNSRKQGTSRQVTGNIEVVSSDSTTNIKVTTVCAACSNIPCSCNCDLQEQESTGCTCEDGNLCGSDTCTCQQDAALYKASSTSTSESYKNCTCCVCDKLPCVCNKLSAAASKDNDEYLGMFIPASRPTVKFATYPSTSRQQASRERDFVASGRCLKCRRCLCVCGDPWKSTGSKATSTILKKGSPRRNEASRYSSLKRVFDNCACTQTSCKCDFVQKLMSRFTQAEVRADTRTEDLQTAFKGDDKVLQTGTPGESHGVGIQTHTDTTNKSLQTTPRNMLNADAQTLISKVGDDVQNVGIQTSADATDEILQTMYEPIFGKKTDGINIGKGVSFDTRSPSRSPRRSPESAQTNQYADASNQRNSPDLHGAAASQTVGSPRIEESAGTQTNGKKRSDSSRPTSSQSSKSDNGKRKIICICCCTQTESKSKESEKSRVRNAKVQVRSGGATSSKEERRSRGDSLTTSSVTYEICPSLLASTYDDTSRSTSEGSSSKSSVLICFCCKGKYPQEKISVLGSRTESFPMCCNCLDKRPILTAVCYAGPQEDCPCAKPQQYQTTTTDTSESLKRVDECTCTKPFHQKDAYCSYCLAKLRNTAKSKNGIAYTLTLENGGRSKSKKKHQRKKVPLEEIRVKVPVSTSSKKKYKDKENITKRDESKGRGCDCGKEMCATDCRMRGVAGKRTESGSSNNKRDQLTLQEHLQKNRPDFIESAETRRAVVLNSRNERQDAGTEAKLRFAEETVDRLVSKKPRKLFTEKEMKRITEKNYKKLPEVRGKLVDIREQKLRSADRYIVDAFTKKIQRSVLRGKSTFPIDSNVICLPKKCNC
ncbi:hypothetical protein NQ315_011785 [Exocentrus adspersus]|uniref:ALMS motif domain-containing protein n=1 Tax=Exocentrus adspersus TaxID=1586481 RepID=A0AAV8W0H7_9CUCU|nr:hypothetical protein NQ315_011785 [Exocentrus adspersus]